MKYDETYIYIYMYECVYVSHGTIYEYNAIYVKVAAAEKKDHEEADDPIYGEHISMEGGGEESIRVNQGQSR